MSENTKGFLWANGLLILTFAVIIGIIVLARIHSLLGVLGFFVVFNLLGLLCNRVSKEYQKPY